MFIRSSVASPCSNKITIDKGTCFVSVCCLRRVTVGSSCASGPQLPTTLRTTAGNARRRASQGGSSTSTTNVNTNDGDNKERVGVDAICGSVSDFPESNSYGSASVAAPLGSSGTSNGTYSSALSVDEDESDSWMRGGRQGRVRSAGKLNPGVSGGGRGMVAGKRRSATTKLLGGSLHGEGYSEGHEDDTSSSTSATLSLQLPFSEDEAALLSDLGQNFQLGTVAGGAAAGVVGSGGGGGVGDRGAANALLVAGGESNRVIFEGLSAEAVRVRIVDLNEELTHLDRCRRSLEAELRQERAR